MKKNHEPQSSESSGFSRLINTKAEQSYRGPPVYLYPYVVMRHSAESLAMRYDSL